MGVRGHHFQRGLGALMRDAAAMVADGFRIRGKRGFNALKFANDLTPRPIPHKKTSKPKGSRKADRQPPRIP